MIKINLALRKTASLVEQGGGASQLTMATLRGLKVNEVLETPAFRQALVLGALMLGGSYWVDTTKENEIHQAQEVIDKLREDQAQIRKSLDETKKYEGLKKALEDDELVIRQKLDVIQKLMSDRAVPPKLLLALSSALPKEVWLSEFRVEPQDITFRGDASDFNQVSDFMKNLNESISFKDVVLRNTQQARDEQGVETAKFEIVVKRR